MLSSRISREAEVIADCETSDSFGVSAVAAVTGIWWIRVAFFARPAVFRQAGSHKKSGAEVLKLVLEQVVWSE